MLKMIVDWEGSMRGGRIIVLASLVASSLFGCRSIECAILCERWVGESMHNPATGQKVLCGGYVQKGDVTSQELDEISACVADRSSKGFVLDLQPSRQKARENSH